MTILAQANGACQAGIGSGGQALCWSGRQTAECGFERGRHRSQQANVTNAVKHFQLGAAEASIRMFSKLRAQKSAGNDQMLNFGGSLIDAHRPYLTIQLFHDRAL